ncbi:MAG: hypothetical protein WC707_01955 [Candidatus Babeliaceae bacterium]
MMQKKILFFLLLRGAQLCTMEQAFANISTTKAPTMETPIIQTMNKLESRSCPQTLKQHVKDSCCNCVECVGACVCCPCSSLLILCCGVAH